MKAYISSVFVLSSRLSAVLFVFRMDISADFIEDNGSVNKISSYIHETATITRCVKAWAHTMLHPCIGSQRQFGMHLATLSINAGVRKNFETRRSKHLPPSRRARVCPRVNLVGTSKSRSPSRGLKDPNTVEEAQCWMRLAGIDPPVRNRDDGAPGHAHRV
jgi:hypothetical protein